MVCALFSAPRQQIQRAPELNTGASRNPAPSDGAVSLLRSTDNHAAGRGTLHLGEEPCTRFPDTTASAATATLTPKSARASGGQEVVEAALGSQQAERLRSKAAHLTPADPNPEDQAARKLSELHSAASRPSACGGVSGAKLPSSSSSSSSSRIALLLRLAGPLPAPLLRP